MYTSNSRIQPPVEDMNRSFNNYESYKRDLKPAASKLEYRKFLSAMQTGKRAYDSNISNAIEYNKRVIAYKNKEQNLRHGALKMNVDHSAIQKKAMQSIAVQNEQQQMALTYGKGKAPHDLPNYSRSSHHYVR